MIPRGEGLNRRQLLSVCLVSLLSPLVRQLPHIAARVGNAGWLCGLAAAPAAALFALLLRRVTRRRAAGEGAADLFLRVYGKAPGGVLLALYALWLLAYAGFVIAAGAARLEASAYPRGGRLFFVFAAAGLGLMAALSRARTLARAANVLRLPMLGVLLLILLAALLDADLKSLFPVTAADALPLLRGGARVSDALLLPAAFAFLLEYVEPEAGPRPLRELLLLGGELCLLCVLLSAAVLAVYGPAFTLSQELPFLAMTRDLRPAGTLERIDALVIGLWVVADFILLAALLLSARTALRRLLRSGKSPLPGVFCAAAAAGFALLCGADGAALDFLAERFFPLTGAFITFGLWPLTLVTGLVRKKI